MNKLATELEGQRKDVCKDLEEVGESLIRNPQHLRPLKLFAERLDVVARQTGDMDLMFLNSYLSLFAGDMYFNLLTDVSSLVKPEDRDKLVKDLGKNLKDLAQAIINRDNKKIYGRYKQIGKIWTKDMPNLGRTPEDELHPQYHKRPKDTTLPLAAIRFNENPATKHCENYLASGFPSDFHKDFDFITIDADIADEIANDYVDKINEIRKEIKINKLAFFDKNYGPIGAIVLANSIISKAEIDAIYVRLRRRVNFDQIKAKEKLNASDTIVIISDVLTTGDGILKAMEIIKKNYKDVQIPYAIVFYDRMQGGERRLKEKGIKLKVIFTREDFAKEDISDKAKPLSITDEIVPLSEGGGERIGRNFWKRNSRSNENGNSPSLKVI
jgi:orotate phosphoribosyltransferase